METNIALILDEIKKINGNIIQIDSLNTNKDPLVDMHCLTITLANTTLIAHFNNVPNPYADAVNNLAKNMSEVDKIKLHFTKEELEKIKSLNNQIFEIHDKALARN